MHHHTTTKAATAMARRAAALVERLRPEQRGHACLPFESGLREDWHFTPRERHGLPLRDMDAGQREAALALLQSGLSDAGFAKARAIMALERDLGRIESRPAFRDPENYAFAVFGEPGRPPWGWRAEGHHLSVHATVVRDDLVAVTPSFWGANPARVPDGANAGLRVLAEEQDRGRGLARSLDGALFERAVIAPAAHPDIITGPGREDSLQAPQGLPVSALDDGRRAEVMALIELFVRNLRPELAEAEWAKVEAAGIEGLRFGWAGGLDDGQGHYYRVHGPAVLIEYDNTQNDANHIHTVWHEPGNAFGRDALRRHYAHGHDHG